MRVSKPGRSRPSSATVVAKMTCSSFESAACMVSALRFLLIFPTSAAALMPRSATFSAISMQCWTLSDKTSTCLSSATRSSIMSSICWLRCSSAHIVVTNLGQSMCPSGYHVVIWNLTLGASTRPSSINCFVVMRVSSLPKCQYRILLSPSGRSGVAVRPRRMRAGIAIITWLKLLAGMWCASSTMHIPNCLPQSCNSSHRSLARDWIIAITICPESSFLPPPHIVTCGTSPLSVFSCALIRSSHCLAKSLVCTNTTTFVVYSVIAPSPIIVLPAPHGAMIRPSPAFTSCPTASCW